MQDIYWPARTVTLKQYGNRTTIDSDKDCSELENVFRMFPPRHLHWLEQGSQLRASVAAFDKFEDHVRFRGTIRVVIVGDKRWAYVEGVDINDQERLARALDSAGDWWPDGSDDRERVAYLSYGGTVPVTITRTYPPGSILVEQNHYRILRAPETTCHGIGECQVRDDPSVVGLDAELAKLGPQPLGPLGFAVVIVLTFSPRAALPLRIAYFA